MRVKVAWIILLISICLFAKFNVVSAKSKKNKVSGLRGTKEKENEMLDLANDTVQQESGSEESSSEQVEEFIPENSKAEKTEFVDLAETTSVTAAKEETGKTEFVDFNDKGNESSLELEEKTTAKKESPEKTEFVDLGEKTTEASLELQEKPAEKKETSEKTEFVDLSEKNNESSEEKPVEKKESSEKTEFVDLSDNKAETEVAEETTKKVSNEKAEFVDLSEKNEEGTEGKSSDLKKETSEKTEFVDLSDTKAESTEEKKSSEAKPSSDKAEFIDLNENKPEIADEEKPKPQAESSEKTEFVDLSEQKTEVKEASPENKKESGEKTKFVDLSESKAEVADAAKSKTSTSEEKTEFVDLSESSKKPSDSAKVEFLDTNKKESETKSSKSSSSGGILSFLGLSSSSKSKATKSETTNPQFLDVSDPEAKPKASEESVSSVSSPSSQVILITGITSAVGSELAKLLLSSSTSAKIYGLVRNEKQTSEVEHISSKIKVVVGDLNDPIQISDLIQELKPTMVYHLAEENEYVSNKASSQQHTVQMNFQGTLTLLEALKRADLMSSTFFYAGSNQEYAESTDCKSIAESSKLDPVSVYGLSKYSSELLVEQYNKNYGLPVYIGRLFTVIGKQSNNDIQEYCKDIVLMELGKKDPVLEISSNVNIVRDFIDARDAASAIQSIVTKGTAGLAYNIGSGFGATTKSALSSIISLSKASNIKAKQVTQLSLRGTVSMNPADKCGIADISILATTGFVPKHSLKESIEESLVYWRAALQQNEEK